MIRVLQGPTVPLNSRQKVREPAVVPLVRTLIPFVSALPLLDNYPREMNTDARENLSWIVLTAFFTRMRN